MSGVRLFMFVVLLPALAALGHDIYLFYTHEGVNNVVADATQAIADKGAFTLFASLGYIWTQYDPENYKLIAQSLDEETWSALNTLLSYKAFFVGLAFAGFFYVLLGCLKLLSVWPFRKENLESFAATNRADQAFGRQKKKMKFKRK